jgi:hypothetical protein
MATALRLMPSSVAIRCIRPHSGRIRSMPCHAGKISQTERSARGFAKDLQDYPPYLRYNYST